MPLFSIDLSGEFQSFLIVEALSAAIGIRVMKLHSGQTFVSVLGYRVSRFSDGIFIGKICTVSLKMIMRCSYDFCVLFRGVARVKIAGIIRKVAHGGHGRDMQFFM